MKKKRQSIHKGIAGIQREIKKEQGFFDELLEEDLEGRGICLSIRI